MSVEVRLLDQFGDLRGLVEEPGNGGRLVLLFSAVDDEGVLVQEGDGYVVELGPEGHPEVVAQGLEADLNMGYVTLWGALLESGELITNLHPHG